MALPVQVLEQLPQQLRAQLSQELLSDEATLPLGIQELDAVLPGYGLQRGGVSELAVVGGAAQATCIALAACRAAQQEAVERGGENPWCAFLDPSNTLYGPAVAREGVQLDRLLIIRPSSEELARVAIRAAQSNVFSVLVIDTVGAPGCSLDVPLGSWARVVRRLAAAVKDSSCCVLLITDLASERPLPLPVAQRIELARTSAHQLEVRVAKDRLGRISSPRSIAWERSVQGLPSVQKTEQSRREPAQMRLLA